MEKTTLKKARAESGLSLSKLAEKCREHSAYGGKRRGVGRRALHYIETGKLPRGPHPETLRIVEKALGLAPGSIEYVPDSAWPDGSVA